MSAPPFELTRPCGNCPFRTDCFRGWLGRERAQEIADGLAADATFSCHKTTGLEGPRRGPEQHCAGALIVLDRDPDAGFGQLARIFGRLGGFDPDALDQTAPVFDTLAAFVEHHSANSGDGN